MRIVWKWIAWECPIGFVMLVPMSVVIGLGALIAILLSGG